MGRRLANVLFSYESLCDLFGRLDGRTVYQLTGLGPPEDLVRDCPRCAPPRYGADEPFDPRAILDALLDEAGATP